LKASCKIRVGSAPAQMNPRVRLWGKSYHSSSDLYQLLAYCVAAGIEAGLLIYPGAPVDGGATEIQNTEIVIRQIRLDLSTPSELTFACLG